MAAQNIHEEAKKANKKVLLTEADQELPKPDNFSTPEELYAELERTVLKYHPSGDLTLIRKAYELARDVHKDQKRKSGEPYVIHPICVAIILADLELDKETIAAGLLHDVVEDTPVTNEDVRREFGGEVELIVDGVTKLGQIGYKADKIETQAENLRKMFLAMARDIRVILVKLADRLHNMRTLQYMRPEKQQEKARETMDIYSPLAQRLGISKIKTELDDLALMYLKPEVYDNLVRQVDARKEQREAFVEGIVKEVRSNLEKSGISGEVNGRVKHFFSIYKKMVTQDKSIDQIYDLFAVRIIVNSVQDCYASLGIIHEMYKPVPGRFKDYIAMPKQNMYQSLHTTLIGPSGTPFEIQIRTWEMHRTAEFGIAAHWKYKEASYGRKVDDQEEAKLVWLRQILEWQQDTSDNKEFLSIVKSDLDLFSENVYCFSPAGDVKVLPFGSCPVDFAYSIHSAIGNKMIGARVNGKLVPIEYRLRNGDRVEILISQNSKGPSRDWLNIVKSSQARTKINQWFRAELKNENIERGKELLTLSARQKGYSLPELTKTEYQEGVMQKYGFKDWESVLAAVGHGGLKENQVINKLIDQHEKDNKKKETDEEILKAAQAAHDKLPLVSRSGRGGIIVKGIHDLAVHFAKCCSPIPGDEIVGYVTRGRGVTVHRTDCVNIMNMSEEERERLMEAEWQLPEDEKNATAYAVEISVYADNRTGLLVDISRTFSDRKIDIGNMNVRLSKQGTATLEISFSVHSVKELETVLGELKKINSIIDVTRKVG
ncbi:MAG: bifunctional (p)ppGpp synthetase/guanosine-3',5'-bis(diphosphate) 3'-pyrophosphohydrolase [Lachnospiraceae bacterium]|nr:bifunctional (p)ppGpp synthetase/guanosine-3',5'-bis(diphosphate) 3'-pyrophosphohydrolase [Lachnospiraceae bacterium]